MSITTLHVLAGGAMRRPLDALAEEFRYEAGVEIAYRFGTTPELMAMAADGASFDLGVVPQDTLEHDATRARFVENSIVDIAGVELGLAVQAGSPKPDITTPGALKSVLLGAQSIAAIPASAAGTRMARLFEMLGITEAMAPKLKVQPAPPAIVRAVIEGDAEFGMFFVNVLMTPGLDVLGRFPEGLRQSGMFRAAMAKNVASAKDAAAFIAYLQTPPAIAVLTAHGMTPPASAEN